MRKPVYTIMCALLVSSCAAGQTRTALKVIPVEGDGAFNDIDKGTALTPVVEVRDEYDRPVPNARVVFSLPSNGPGGSFTDGRSELIAMTDERGRAAARGFRPNKIEGRFPIRVTASVLGRKGSATVWQSNTMAGGSEPIRRSSSKKKYIILGLLGGAAAGGIIAATQGGGGGSGAAALPPTTLSPGSVTVGGPR